MLSVIVGMGCPLAGISGVVIDPSGASRPAFIDSSDLGASVKGFCNHNTIVSCLPTKCRPNRPGDTSGKP